MSAYNACSFLACTHELTPPPFATTPRLPRRYDVSNPEELSTQFAEAMVKVQKGFKSISMMLMGLGYGIGATIVAFIPSIGQWEVALVVMATVPLLIGAASLMMYVVQNGSKLVDKAYAQAGGIATECLFSMRTITSLGVERTFEGRYSSSLARVRRAFITNTTVLGFSGGLALSAYLVMMVLIRASNLHVTACLP